MAAHEHHTPCEVAVRLDGRMENAERSLSVLRAVVFGNGRNPLRQDIDMNTRTLEELNRAIESRQKHTWAMWLIVVTAGLNLLSALVVALWAT